MLKKGKFLKAFLVGIISLLLLISPQNSALAVKQIKVQFFPWKMNTTWKLAADFHGKINGKAQNALDFATLDGKPGEVYAADDGIIKSAKETCVVISRSDGLELGYQHINKADISKLAKKIGKPIYAGDYIGKTTLEAGCGGTTSGHHVHFWAQGSLGPFTYGSEIAGWVIKKYVYKYPNSKVEYGAKLTYGVNDGLSLFLEAIVCLPSEGSGCKYNRIIFREYRND